MTTVAIIALGVVALTIWGAALVHASDLKRIADLEARLEGAGHDVSTVLRQTAAVHTSRYSHPKAAAYRDAADIAVRVLDGGA